MLEDSSDLVIKGYDLLIVNTMLEYVYTGEVLTQDIDVLHGLSMLSDAYQVIGLREACIRNVYRSIQHEADSKEMFKVYYELGKRFQSSVFMKMAVNEFST